MPPSHWLQPSLEVVSWITDWCARAQPWTAAPGFCEKAGRANYESRPVNSTPPRASASVPASWLLPWAPALTPLNDGVWYGMEDEINPPSPSCFWWMFLSAQQKPNWNGHSGSGGVCRQAWWSVFDFHGGRTKLTVTNHPLDPHTLVVTCTCPHIHSHMYKNKNKIKIESYQDTRHQLPQTCMHPAHICVHTRTHTHLWESDFFNI